MIETHVHNSMAHFRLARGAKRNALTPEMLRGLRGAVEGLEGRDARVIVVSGEGEVFCAGFDLSLCRDSPDGAVMRELLSALADAIRVLRSQARPVVVAAHGAAIAGGCALLGGADFVITNDGARIGYPVVRLGVSPAVSAAYLRLMVGDGRARERQLDPGLVSGKEAERLGLVWQSLASADEVLPCAMALGEGLAAKGEGALIATRAWLGEIEDTVFPRGIGSTHEAAKRGLAASLSLAGGEEERDLLPRAWTK